MLRSGNKHRERRRDGRGVPVGNERIGDVLSHPFFRNAAGAHAVLAELRARPA